MSWGEVFAINTNMQKPLNEQLREMKFLPIRVITESTTYTPEKTGLYKVICVGAGGSGFTDTSSSSYRASGGAAGGVAIKTLTLSASQSYNVTVGTTASFSTTLTATAGTSTRSGGAGGTGTGGDYNFTGEIGQNKSEKNSPMKGGSVGVVISDLARSRDTMYVSGSYAFTLPYGDSLLGHGGGGTAIVDASLEGMKTSGLSAAVIIIPLEMEE